MEEWLAEALVLTYDAQWRGVQMLYLYLLHDPLHILAFSKETADLPPVAIRLILQLLQSPLANPEQVFPEDVQQARVRMPVDSGSHLPVIQAQLAGLLLSILLVLCLADNAELKQLLHAEHVEDILLKLAWNQTANMHPYLKASVGILERDRPDVLSKLTALYRSVVALHTMLAGMTCQSQTRRYV